MAWKKREATSNVEVIGDAEGHIKSVGGLLASINQDRRYPDNMNYEIVRQSGESVMIAGSTSINMQIMPDDIGKFVKMKFLGWGSGANGKFKKIEVIVWEGEPTDEMKKWPRFGEFNDGGPADAEPVDDADDLPF